MRRHISRKLLLCGALFALAGCNRPNPEFPADGFHADEFPIVVRYADAKAQTFVGPDWRTDNFVIDEAGRVRDRKDTPDYRVDVKLDLDGDGKLDEFSGWPMYQLSLVHRRTDARIWIQAMPVSERDKDRDLKVVLDDFVEGLSGTGLYRFRSGPREPVAVARTYGTRVVQQKETKVGTFDALDATIEVINLDQQKVDPTTKSAVGRVVFVRPPYVNTVRGVTGMPNPRAFIVLGCESKPRDFEATSADFDRFLAAVELGPDPYAKP